MFKLSIKSSIFVSAVIFIVSVFTSIDASAQTHRMKRIQKSLAKAEINVPPTVMLEIEEIENKLQGIKKLKQNQEHVGYRAIYNSYETGHASALKKLEQDPNYRASPEWKELNRQLTEDYVKQLVQHEKDYRNSEEFKAFIQQEDELRAEALNLIKPYVIKYDVTRINERSKKQAKEQKSKSEDPVDLILERIKKGYEHYDEPLSAEDVTKLEILLRESRPYDEKLLALHKSGNHDSSEHDKILALKRENQRKRRTLLEPYSDKKKVKQRAVRAVLREYEPRLRAPTEAQKDNKIYKRSISAYERHGISIAAEDEQDIKRIIREVQDLREKAYLLRENKDFDINSAEAQDYKRQYEALEIQMENIRKPYDEQLESRSKR